jgi:EAL domain-containing protein (putative c-di-GMP-specific phosphodiesterase class I)
MRTLYTHEQPLSGLLDGGHLRIAFQPIVGLRRNVVHGLEALLRIEHHGRWFPPAGAFARAAAAGRALDLELAALAAALARLDDVPDGAFLAVNAAPSTICAPVFTGLLDDLDLACVVVEVTERETIDDYAEINEVLAPLRRRGLRVAIDDTGAGASTLRHVLRLRPDIVKLDVSLVDEVCTDPVQRALVTAFVRFTTEIGAGLIAEGIEDPAQAPMLRDLGVELGQGFALGRPRPLDRRV